MPPRRTLMQMASRELPYEGAKEMLLVEDIDNRDFLRKLIDAMDGELPVPKKRAKQIAGR